MNVVSERLESVVLRRGWKRVDRRCVAAIGVEAELRALGVRAGGVVCDVPSGIHDDVLPTVALQMLGHPLRVGADVGFADRFAIGVPTIPTHRRSGGQQSW